MEKDKKKADFIKVKENDFNKQEKNGYTEQPLPQPKDYEEIEY